VVRPEPPEKRTVEDDLAIPETSSSDDDESDGNPDDYERVPLLLHGTTK